MESNCIAPVNIVTLAVQIELDSTIFLESISGSTQNRPLLSTAFGVKCCQNVHLIISPFNCFHLSSGDYLKMLTGSDSDSEGPHSNPCLGPYNS